MNRYLQLRVNEQKAVDQLINCIASHPHLDQQKIVILLNLCSSDIRDIHHLAEINKMTKDNDDD